MKASSPCVRMGVLALVLTSHMVSVAAAGQLGAQVVGGRMLSDRQEMGCIEASARGFMQFLTHRRANKATKSVLADLRQNDLLPSNTVVFLQLSNSNSTAASEPTDSDNTTVAVDATSGNSSTSTQASHGAYAPDTSGSFSTEFKSARELLGTTSAAPSDFSQRIMPFWVKGDPGTSNHICYAVHFGTYVVGWIYIGAFIWNFITGMSGQDQLDLDLAGRAVFCQLVYAMIVLICGMSEEFRTVMDETTLCNFHKRYIVNFMYVCIFGIFFQIERKKLVDMQLAEVEGEDFESGIIRGEQCDSSIIVTTKCNQGAPDFHKEGRVCASEGQPQEAYCSYDFAPDACAYCFQVPNDASNIDGGSSMSKAMDKMPQSAKSILPFLVGLIMSLITFTFTC